MVLSVPQGMQTEFGL